MERIPPKRRRGGRRKGEQASAVLGNEDLFELLGCNDIDALLRALTDLGVEPHVSGWDARRFVAVTTHDLPEQMRERAFEIAAASSGWVGKR
jgi:hypothetical protein